MIVVYDAQKRNWNEVLERAWASRPPGETGMIVAIPEGGRLHREMLKKVSRGRTPRDRRPGQIPT